MGGQRRLGRLTPGNDPVPIVQEAGWAPGPVWTGATKLELFIISGRTLKIHNLPLYCELQLRTYSFHLYNLNGVH